jgi:large subunit ribosomal protein L4
VSALSLKAGENAVHVIDTLKMSAPKTKDVAEALKKLGLDSKRTLLVLETADENVVKSCRNIRNLQTMLAHQLNPYEVMDCDVLLITAAGLERVKEVFVK